jgi:hypothetical protein
MASVLQWRPRPHPAGIIRHLCSYIKVCSMASGTGRHSLCGNKTQRCSVHAVPQPSGRRAIVKDVAKVAAT